MRLGAKYLALPLILACGSANALEVNCDYSDKTIVKTVGKIDAIKNYQYKVADYAEEKRICAVNFDAKIGENWYNTKNFYVFGPEMSQNEACNKAKDKAKVSVLEDNAPQVVENEIEHICEETIVHADPKPAVTNNQSRQQQDIIISSDDYWANRKAGHVDTYKDRHENNMNVMRLFNFVGLLYGQFGMD